MGEPNLMELHRAHDRAGARKGLKRERGADDVPAFADPSNSAAVPATVSGEQDIDRPSIPTGQSLSRMLFDARLGKARYQAMTRKPGDLPAHWSLFALIQGMVSARFLSV